MVVSLWAALSAACAWYNDIAERNKSVLPAFRKNAAHVASHLCTERSYFRVWTDIRRTLCTGDRNGGVGNVYQLAMHV